MISIAYRILIGVLTGSISGLIVLGAGGRIAMRLIAILARVDGGFSWGGTLDILLLGLIIGAVSGGIYAAITAYSPLNVVLNGILFGLLTFGAIIILPIDGKGAASGFPELFMQVYIIFGAIFAIFGLIQSILYRKWQSKINTKNQLNGSKR